MNIYLITLIVIIMLMQTGAFNNTESFQIEHSKVRSPQMQAKSIDKLVQEQTDLIKQIVSNHKSDETAVEYPVVTRKEAVDPLVKGEKERQSIEDLRRRCQELFKFSNLTEEEQNQNSNRMVTVEAFGPNRKPEFLERLKPSAELPSNFSKPSQVEEISTKYFVVNKTNESETSEEEEKKAATNHLLVQNVEQPANIKYVQLEPVILQRMILNNGRMLFYWYKSIPAIPQIVTLPKYQTSRFTDMQTYQALQLQNSQPIHSNPLASHHQMHQPSTTQTYQDSVKMKEILTEDKMETPNYEVEYGTNEKSDDLYTKQMKFVIPMPYQTSGIESRTHYPSQFDPYAYYPKQLQPGFINVPVPYVPTFQMIKTIRMPEN